MFPCILDNHHVLTAWVVLYKTTCFRRIRLRWANIDHLCAPPSSSSSYGAERRAPPLPDDAGGDLWSGAPHSDGERHGRGHPLRQRAGEAAGTLHLLFRQVGKVLSWRFYIHIFAFSEPYRATLNCVFTTSETVLNCAEPRLRWTVSEARPKRARPASKRDAVTSSLVSVHCWNIELYKNTINSAFLCIRNGCFQIGDGLKTGPFFTVLDRSSQCCGNSFMRYCFWERWDFLMKKTHISRENNLFNVYIHQSPI